MPRSYEDGAMKPALPLNPPTRIRLHEGIVEQLKDRIISGALPAGSKLPPERQLAEQLRVNRTTVREALHKLESMGLVKINHGSGVYVRDFLESGTLELARYLFFVGGEVDKGMLHDVLDLRRLLLPAISAQAAAHRTEDDMRLLESLCLGSDEMPIEERDWRVHNAIARASGNLLFVVLLNAFTGFGQELAKPYFKNAANQQRSLAFHREIFAAISARDSDAASRIMVDALDYAEAFTRKVFGIETSNDQVRES